MPSPAPPIPTIAELDLARHGVTAIKVWCDKCHHQAAVPLEAIDGRQTIPEFAGRLRCSACGETSCSAMPGWPAVRDTGRAHNHGGERK